MLAVDWRNPLDRVDVSADGNVVPQDVLLVINELNRNGARALPAMRPAGAAYVDTTGDNFLAPLDALLVINELNKGVLGTRVLSEGTQLAAEQSLTVTLGQLSGSREYRVQLDASFDTSATGAAIEDVLAVYLLDPVNPGQTILDRGTPGTALFTLAGTRAEFAPGLVRWDGSVLTIDTTSLSPRDTSVLTFQLLNSDTDLGTRVAIRPLSNDIDPVGVASPQLPDQDCQPPMTVPRRRCPSAFQ